MASKLLRGPGFRRERRVLRRAAKRGVPVSTEHVTVLNNDEFNAIVADLQDTHFEPLEDYDVCGKCGAKNEEKCRTLTTGKTTDRHKGRGE